MNDEPGKEYVLVMQHDDDVIEVISGDYEKCRKKLNDIAGREVDANIITLGDNNYSIIESHDFATLKGVGRTHIR